MHKDLTYYGTVYEYYWIITDILINGQFDKLNCNTDIIKQTQDIVLD